MVEGARIAHAELAWCLTRNTHGSERVSEEQVKCEGRHVARPKIRKKQPHGIDRRQLFAAMASTSASLALLLHF